MLKRLTPNNIHVIERVFRVLLGLTLLALVFVGPKTPWGALGIVPLVTGIVGTCPLYTILGVKTCGTKCKTST